MKKHILSRKKSLKKIFDKYISIEQYGEFKEIIDEVLLRRAITFEFSNQRMEEESKKLSENLKAISFYKGNNNDTSLAYYSEIDQNIHINENYIKYLKQSIDKSVEEYYKTQDKELSNLALGNDIFQVFSHELYHAISPQQIKEKRTYKSNNGNIIFYRTAINEIVTESASSLTTTYPIEENSNGYTQTLGYPEYTFAGALLACALGVSERELYKNGLNSRDEWDKFLKTKIYNGKDNDRYIAFEDFLDYTLYANKMRFKIDNIELFNRNC